MTTRIKLRRDTAANWTSNDPVLALGEAGYDTTNNQLRVGDGTTVWSGLDAIGGGISNAVAIAPEFGPAITFVRPEDVATTATNAVDVIDTGLALGRNSQYGGLLNTLEDSLDGYGDGSGQNYVGQPTHTEWNTDGLADLSNITTRTYQDFKDMKQDLGDDAFLATQLVMHDTLNDKYYTFKFSRWSVGENGGDGGYSYVRRLINHTQYFDRADNDTGAVDVIDTGLTIARGNNGGIYNFADEADWDRDVSPSGTEWNVDGWSDLSNLLTRTYTNFASAFSYQIGERVVGREAIMHDTINDEYYAVKFTRWGSNNGAGFTWQRRLIDTTQLDEGLHFADGTVQTTAGVTFDANGSINLSGGIVLPYLSNMGYSVLNTLNGPTLQLSNDSNNQVIITGPAATENNNNAQRIVIQGQRGYGSTSTTGEGGDVYIWGGVGGESNSNSNGWGHGGGSGGDIKLRGGEGLNDEGGYVRIEGGNVAHWNTSTTGNAGFVEITGGDVTSENAAGSSYGGDVRITGGRAYTATTQSGVVQVITGGYINGGNPGDKIWTFGNDGSLTLPGAITRVVAGTVAKDGPVGSDIGKGEAATVTVSPSNNTNLTVGTVTGVAFGTGFTLDITVAVNGDISAVVTASNPNIAVGDYGTVLGGGSLGGTVGIDDITFTVATITSVIAPTAIDLTKTVNKLADGSYTLADGVEGQIMYLVRQTGSSKDNISINVANARIDGILNTTIDHFPFENVPNVNMNTLIFTDGAWQASNGGWD